MRTLVVAPHPDDELLGCGGTLIRRNLEGGTLGWLMMTSLREDRGWNTQRIKQRSDEINQVRRELHIASEHLYSLDYPTAELDQFSMSDLVGRISTVFKDFQPEEVLLPHPGDVHSDHRVTFEAASACTKWFRYASVRRVMTYETPSETEFGLNPVERTFQPNHFVDISEYLDTKLKLLNVYESELGNHPFPRSLESIRALALLRGSQIGAQASEAFQILKQIE